MINLIKAPTKIQVLEKACPTWGFPLVRCCVCSHEFYLIEKVEPECSWCKDKEDQK